MAERKGGHEKREKTRRDARSDRSELNTCLGFTHVENGSRLSQVSVVLTDIDNRVEGSWSSLDGDSGPNDKDCKEGSRNHGVVSDRLLVRTGRLCLYVWCAD